MSVIPLEIEMEEQNEEIVLELENKNAAVYDDLIGKPTLDGKTIQGNMYEQDPTVPEWAKQPSKPSYTPKEIGIGSIPLTEIVDMFKNW